MVVAEAEFVSAKDASLAEAKLVNGLRADFGEVGIHISNTGDAKAFALLSEEGIAKGIRRITAVTIDHAYDAKKAIDLLEQQVDDAYKLEGSLMEEVVVGKEEGLLLQRLLNKSLNYADMDMYNVSEF
ncbi:hypothetical protein RIF29_14105 [Crotalaria pallida]|uniref:Threonyl/alanyl tRNA synthetase SAD domain-containing protein n=1 Tax=Crotalaria pallida TaxID=3830 RepID=A0AAN9FB55_CROPI